jgi:hypothetical protein
MVFSRIVKKLQLPGTYSDASNMAFGSDRIVLQQAASVNVKPGDIVTFSYGGGLLAGSRRFLVVGTKRHPGGGFLSSRGNYLICGYDLTKRESLPGLTMIFNSFYKNNNSNYEKMQSTMSSIFGDGSYKTFNSAKMKSVYKLQVVLK